MNKFTNIPTRVAASSAIAASIAMVVAGLIAISHEQSSQETIVGTIEHIHIGLFTAVQLLLVAPVLYLTRLAGKQKFGFVAAVAGLVLAGLTVSSNIMGEDASFFFAIAIPTNLSIFAAMIAIGRGLYKRELIGKFLAFAFPLSYMAFLQGHDAGGPILTGALWMWVGWSLLNEQLAVVPRRPGLATA